MEHAIRYHIRTHLDDDPVYYRNISEQLEEILQRQGSNWDAIAQEFINLAQQVRTDQSEENQTYIRIRPFYNALIDTLDSPTPEQETRLQQFAIELVDFIHQKTSIIDFWNQPAEREDLRKNIWQKIEDLFILSDSKLDGLADQITQLAERHDPNRRR